MTGSMLGRGGAELLLGSSQRLEGGVLGPRCGEDAPSLLRLHLLRLLLQCADGRFPSGLRSSVPLGSRLAVASSEPLVLPRARLFRLFEEKQANAFIPSLALTGWPADDVQRCRSGQSQSHRNRACRKASWLRVKDWAWVSGVLGALRACVCHLPPAYEGSSDFIITESKSSC